MLGAARSVILLDDLGPELFPYGTFDTDTTGWNIVGATCTIAVVSGELEVTNAGAAGGSADSDAIAVAPFKRHRLRYRARRGTSSSVTVAVRATPGDAILASVTITATGNQDSFLDFVATTAGCYVRVSSNQAVLGRTGYFDNISVREFR